MSTAQITDFREAGIWPLQDHDDVEPADRLQMVGCRIIPPKGADDPWAGHVIDDDANGGKKGTVGDIHPWRFFSPGGRDTGMWAQFVVGRVTDAAAGSRSKDKKGRTITPGVAFQSADAKPVRNADFDTDGGFLSASHEIPTFWPAFPKGFVVGLSAGTKENSQENLAFPLDPRLVAVNKNKSDRMGTMVCDLAPADTISTERVARIQTAWRVAHIPSIKVQVSKGLDAHWTAAWQHGLTGQGDQCGFGSVYGQLEADDRKGDTTPGDKPKRDPVITPGDGGGAGGSTTFQPGGAVDTSADDRVSGGPGSVDTLPGDGVGGGGTKPGKKAPKFGVALFAREAWGPMHCGHENDKHQYGVNKDGEPVNSGHIDVDRAFHYRDRDHDGTLEYDRLPYGPAKAPLRTRAWIRWDQQDFHAWNGQIIQGKWRLEAESFFAGKAPPTTPPKEPRDPDPPITPTPEEPPKEPTDPPITPGDPGTPTFPPPSPPPPGIPETPGINPPTTPGSGPPGREPVRQDPEDKYPGNDLLPGDPRVGRRYGQPGVVETSTERRPVQRADPSTHVAEQVAYSPMQIGFPGALIFPEHFGRAGATDLRYSADPDGATQERAFKTTPAVLRIGSWGAQSGQEWTNTQRAGYSRVPGGTASGGLIFMPPEVDEMDYTDSFAPAGVSRSTSYVAFAPGVYSAWGVMDPTTGDLANNAHRAFLSTATLTFQRKSGGSWTDDFSINASGDFSIPGALIVTGSARFKKRVSTTTNVTGGNVNVTVTAANTGTTFNNFGSNAQVTYNLPAASDGLWYTWIVQAAQNVVIQLSGSEVLTVEAGATTGGGTATANQIGAFIVIEAANGGWVATSYSITHAWALA